MRDREKTARRQREVKEKDRYRFRNRYIKREKCTEKELKHTLYFSFRERETKRQRERKRDIHTFKEITDLILLFQHGGRVSVLIDPVGIHLVDVLLVQEDEKH